MSLYWGPAIAQRDSMLGAWRSQMWTRRSCGLLSVSPVSSGSKLFPSIGVPGDVCPPAISSSVGNRSRCDPLASVLRPASNRPGHLARKGDSTPPSYTEPLPPRKPAR